MASNRGSVFSDSIDGVADSLPEMLRRSRSRGGESDQWRMLGRTFPSSEVRFFAQVFCLYIVIFTCLGNLSMGNGELTTLWTTLLASSVGYLLPNPAIRKSRGREVVRMQP